MRQIDLNTALDAIRSDKVKTVTEGLSNFEYLLKAKGQNSKLQKLAEEDHRYILDSLFKTVGREKNRLLPGGSTSKPLTAATKRSQETWATCWRAVRVFLEVCTPSLSFATVRYALDYFLEETRGHNGNLFEPILDDYFKALQAVLQHRPHLEHLREDLWLDLVDFCCEALSLASPDQTEPTSISQPTRSARTEIRSTRSSRAGTPAQGNDAANGQRHLSNSDSSATFSSRRLDDLVLCLDLLFSTRHINILRRSGEVLPPLFKALRSTLNENRPSMQQPCFSCINSILHRSMSENLQLAKSTFISAIYYIRRGWSSKIATDLREQMLIVLIRCQTLIPLIVEKDSDGDAVDELNGLLDRLQSEYQDRMINHMLQMGDIGLSLVGFDPSSVPLRMETFCIRNANPSAESSWVQLSLMADLFFQLRILPACQSLDTEEDQVPAKRTKHESPLHDLIRSISTSQREKQLSSLQLLTFVLATVSVDRVEDLQMLLENLFPLISRDTGEIASWAMLSLVMLSRQDVYGKAALQDITWFNVLHVSITRFSSSRVARLACNLADSILSQDLVSFSEAADILDGLLASIDVGGPAGLSDAAIEFLKTVLALYSINRAASYEIASSSILRWLFGVWRPSQLDLRSSEHANNHTATVPDILGLTQILVGEKNVPKIINGRRTLSLLSRAKRACEEDRELTRFLVADTNAIQRSSPSGREKLVKRSEPQLSSRSKRMALVTVSDYLMSELEAFLSTQSGSLAMGQLSQANLRNSLVTVVIGLGVADLIADLDMSRSNQLFNRAIELRDQAAKVFFQLDISSDNVRSMRDVLFSVFQDLVILPLKSFKDLSCLQLAIVRTARVLDQNFWRKLHEKESGDDDDILGLIPVEESQSSRTSQKVSSPSAGGSGKDWLTAYSDDSAYRNTVRADICLASTLPDPYSMSNDDASIVPQSVVDHLLSLSAIDFVSCRPFLDNIYEAKLEFSVQAGISLLDYIGTKIFQSEELQLNEAAMGTCLDLLSHLVHYWATTDMETDISDAANQLYDYFVRASKRRALTPHVQIRMANMLQRVIRKSAAHGRSDNRPSSRTNLFKLLETGSVKVKYQISHSIAAIFGFFLLRDHEMVLDDIEKSIPHDPESVEVTAVRLHLLSRLAASWSTLIRRCVYAIVDATGLMPAVIPYARSCLKILGESLGMKDLQSLFRLFVPQILYTWLESRTVISLPYSIFEYDTLKSMVDDVKHEIAAQIVMRGKDSEIDDIAALAGSKFSSLLSNSFGKCAAYCIARDTAVAPEADPQAANAARRLRHHVGREEYATLISEHFPEIIATFFKILDREDQITKSFLKNPGHAGAQEAFEQMISSGASQNTPPVSQQPSFRSNCLIDELDYVCKRSPYDIHQLWTPPLFVYIFRGLLETIHPALGQLHAAAVVRRIRILVSMGRNIALEGYPLEMALGSLRAHLDNTHSAEDVMGLYRYLLKAGESYLSLNLSFLTGFIVSVFVSLKALVEKPQESTTQESTFQATLKRAHEFHNWMSQYALSLDISGFPAESQQSFRDLVSSASNLTSRGSSTRDSPEGELLFRLLDDESTGRRLIDDVTRKEIMSLLCRDFRYSGDYRTDILSDGNIAASHASAALQMYGLKGLDSSFNLWILRALGRSYAAEGFIEPSFRQEISERKEVHDILHNNEASPIVSASAIVRLLYQVACSNSTVEAGFAERTVQSLLSKAISSSSLKDINSAVPPNVLAAMDWQIFAPPLLVSEQSLTSVNLQEAFFKPKQVSFQKWCIGVCLSLIENSEEDPFLADLKLALIKISGFAEEALPYILHMILVKEAGKQEQTKRVVSGVLKQMMLDYSADMETRMKQMLNTIIYLRSQPMPFESTKSDRAVWLDVDYRLAADVAVQCRLYKTALLFVETALSRESKVKGSRRSSAAKVDTPTELLLQIFQNIEEKDYYYGVRQPTSLSSMMDRLDMEQAGFRSLSFRGAAFDVQSRRGAVNSTSVDALIKSLNNLELSSLSQAITASTDVSSTLLGETTFDAVRKLEKWDIPCPDTPASPAMTLFKAFQTTQSVSEHQQLHSNMDKRLESMSTPLQGSLSASSTPASYWSSLAALVEMEEILTAKGPQQLQETWEKLESRGEWLRSANSDHTERLLSSRETLFSILDGSSGLQQLVRSPPKQVRQVQIRSLLESSAIHRSHGNLQKSLAAATAIEQLLPSCEELGLKIEAAALIEVSNVMWDNEEMASSIRVLQNVCSTLDLTRQDISVGKPELLAKLAQRVSEARLEQPEEVLSHYLEPAVKELRGTTSGDAAGQVFHEFASFCDQQLQNPESVGDFRRAQKLRDDKAEEIRELDQMIKDAPARSKERDNLKSYRSKAKQWYDLDNAEYKRLQSSRDTLLRQSLENYLRCLKACDSFDRDAIRFSALWLEHHSEDVANEVVAGHIGDVGSRKFANLMNQWTSRLLDEDTQFQQLLSDLIQRICSEHPYHGMYNMFSSSRSKGGKDQAAMSRWAAANSIVKRLRGSKEIEARWLALHNSCVQYVRFASERPDDGKYKSGAKVLLEKSQTGAKLQEVIGMKMPPATMKIELRKDCDYKNVPVIVRWSREFSVASGLSAPKIITAFASNGQKYKELFKAGNDDLRQDAIMEQVFEQVSELLVSHRDTRRRRLGIRSYKVLPLTAGSGIIEFVSNTIPINDYLVPAHSEHYPNDLKASAARSIIHAAAASGRNDHRVMEYRRVCERFHPVLRYFFMERFENPDDWFEKRLAYTRTTAAVSMLGHILGLGDRHGHNILLDEKTGEVVHIDLGIAFEQGRILPVPELVPFRLTRDIVDGFGVTRTEGVFRRCCEFTLDALRKESYSIMTILDVLRYDPLYSWSLSPLRLKRLQEDKLNDDEDQSAINNRIAGSEKPEKKENEEAEADRALTVVDKKLSKSLSVEATVNELIQQASDERNLALLFAGWAAYI